MTPAMPIVAVLFAAPPPPGVAAPLIAGGITVLERQRRQVRRAGVSRVIVVGDTPFDPASLDGDGNVLVIDPGIILDDRIVALVAAAVAPAVATWPAASGFGTERIDGRDTAAGIALYPAALVRATATALGDWDLGATLLRAALAGGATRIDLAAQPVWAAGRERDVPLVWARPDDADGAAAATTALLAAARADGGGWPLRVVTPPVDDALVRLLLPWPVLADADAVAVAAFAAALGAAAAFATGWLWTGLLLALGGGALAGAAVILARVRVENARRRGAGAAAAVIDYSWYAALAAHFAAAGQAGAWALAAMIIGFALAAREQSAFVRRVTGRPLAAAGAFERRVALFGAGRDTRLWALLPFAAAGRWYAGFAVLAVYTAATFFAVQRRSFIALDASRTTA